MTRGAGEDEQVPDEVAIAKTLAPTMPVAPPRWIAPTMRNGAAAAAASKPTPWLTLLAISSPGD
jgi:hypothetical protein